VHAVAVRVRDAGDVAAAWMASDAREGRSNRRHARADVVVEVERAPASRSEAGTREEDGQNAAVSGLRRRGDGTTNPHRKQESGKIVVTRRPWSNGARPTQCQVVSYALRRGQTRRFSISCFL
jgi:hypothetical protein